MAEHWYDTTALDDLLGVDTAAVNDARLYRALDKLGDVPARAAERRLYAAFLPRGPSPAGLHSTGPERASADGGSRRRDSCSELARHVPPSLRGAAKECSTEQ